MRLTIFSGLLVALVCASPCQARAISGADAAWDRATDILCRSDDNGHLERNVDMMISDIGASTVDDEAERGNPTALFLRGFGESRGLGGFNRSLANSKNDLRRSALADHPLGAIWYATDHLNPKKQSEIIMWLKRGAQPDCAFAEFVYAVTLSANQEPRLRVESHSKGLLILEELASEGYATAQLVLSTFLRSGRNGARIDHPRALKLLTAAADDGHPAAMSTLAYSYLDGKDVAKDPGKAIEILLRIAEAGDPNRYAEVGELYLAGKDIARDLDKAQQYFDLAAKNGVTVKAEKLAELRAGQAEAARRAEAYPALSQKQQYSERMLNFFVSPDIEWPENEGIIKRVGLNRIEIFGGAIFLRESEQHRIRSVKVQSFERKVTVVYESIVRDGQNFRSDDVVCILNVLAIPKSEPWSHERFVRTMQQDLASKTQLTEAEISRTDLNSAMTISTAFESDGQTGVLLHKMGLLKLNNGQQILVNRGCGSIKWTSAQIEEREALRALSSQNSQYFYELAQRYEENLKEFTKIELIHSKAHKLVHDLRKNSCHGTSPLFNEWFELDQRFLTEKPYLSSQHFLFFVAQFSRLEREIATLVGDTPCP